MFPIVYQPFARGTEGLSQSCCNRQRVRLAGSGMKTTPTTMADLRTSLTQHFDATALRTVLLRLREAEMLPAGCAGRGGSAAIEPRHAALALLALVSGAVPMEAPAAAQELAAYRVTAYFWPLVGPCTRCPVDSAMTLGDWLAEEIADAADPRHRTAGLYVELGQRVSTLDRGEIAELERLPGAVPVLREVQSVRERLEFNPAVTRPASLAVVVRPELIRAVAAAFAAPVRPSSGTVLGGGWGLGDFGGLA